MEQYFTCIFPFPAIVPDTNKASSYTQFTLHMQDVQILVLMSQPSQVVVEPLEFLLQQAAVADALHLVASLSSIVEVAEEVFPFCMQEVDAAVAAVGAISDEITGKVIIDASPTFLIASRRDNPAK